MHDGNFGFGCIDKLRREAEAIRELLRTRDKRIGENGKGPERKSNLTDSAKMATAKSVIQSYTGVATVDSACQITVAVQAHGSGSEQSLLLPMIEHAMPYASQQAVMTADAGYHSEVNLKQLYERGIAALLQQGAGPLHLARADEGRHAMEAVLPSSQYRAAGASRVRALGKEQREMPSLAKSA